MVKLLLSHIQLDSLLIAALAFAVGAGLSLYLGHKIDWTAYLFGQVGVTLLQLSSYYLKAFYDPPSPNTRPIHLQEARYQKVILLQTAAMLMTIGVVVTISLFANGSIKLATFIVLGVAFLLTFFYGVPPIRLVYSGYGELVEAFFIANLTPALSFLLQANSMNQFLIMITVPITVLIFARTIANSLSTYADDLKYERRTLLVRIGWQRGMNLHHLLVLMSYLLLVWATFWDLPWSFAWRGLLSLPVALFQIFQLARIAGGASPNWKLLNLTTTTTVVLTVVLILMNLWSL